ncbi:MAG: DUF4388 domain-containing protein [Actinobacteria bacterium]|nr:DUF4388 domain-containing protein [Actinomycetota bacterium]
MRGDLSEISLADLLRGLSSANATGALHIEGRTGPARIFIRDGAVYWAASPAPRAQLGARLVGAGFIAEDELEAVLTEQRRAGRRTKLGALLVERGSVSRDVIRVFVQEQILDAVFDLARWHGGRYEFFRGDAAPEDLPVQIPVQPLLVESARRLVEWERILAVIPSLDAVPDFVPDAASTQVSLEPDDFTVLANVDGQRSVRELAQDLGYSEFEAARLVYGLTLLGIIGVHHDGGTPAVARAPVAEPARTETGRPQAAAPAAEPPAQAAEPPAQDNIDVDDIDVGAALDEALTHRLPHEAPVQAPDEAPDDFDVGAALEAAMHGLGPDVDDEPAEDGFDVGAALEEALSIDLDDAMQETVEEHTELDTGGEDVTSRGVEPEVWRVVIGEDDVIAEPAPEARHDRERPRTPQRRQGPVDRAGPVAEPVPPPRREPAANQPPDADEQQVADELRSLVAELGEDVAADDEVEAGEHEAHAQATGEEPTAAPTRASTDDDRQAPAEPDASEEDRPPSEPHPRRADISELLRELSQLSGRDERGRGPAPPAGSPPADDRGDESEHKRKDEDDEPKRGGFRRLFGPR